MTSSGGVGALSFTETVGSAPEPDEADISISDGSSDGTFEAKEGDAAPRTFYFTPPEEEMPPAYFEVCVPLCFACNFVAVSRCA